MTLADYLGKRAQLEKIALEHIEKHVELALRRDLLMPFYCCYLPYRIMQELGPFDESFGSGGAEDIDFRVRALLAGYDVRYTTQSYVLHFMGQSTWRSGETGVDTEVRNQHYRRRFTEKMGSIPGFPSTTGRPGDRACA